MKTALTTSIATLQTPASASPTTLSSCPSPIQPNHDEQPPNQHSAIQNQQYPLHALPRSLQSLTHRLSHVFHLPSAHVATTGLALLSAAIGSTPVLTHHYGLAQTRANLFCLLLAPDSPAAAHAFRHAAAPLIESHRDFEESQTTSAVPSNRIDLANLRRERRQLLAEGHPGHHRRLTSLDEEIASIQTFLNRDYLECATHLPKGKLLPRLLTQPYGFAWLNPDARQAAAAFCASPGSAAAHDEATLLAGHRGQPILSERLVKGTHLHQTPSLTLLWHLRPKDWQTLAQNPRTQSSPLLPKFLIVDPTSVALPGRAKTTSTNSNNLPDSTVTPPASTTADATPSSYPSSPSHPSYSTAPSPHGATPLATPPFATLWPQSLSSLLSWKLEAPITLTLTPGAESLLDSYEHECAATPDPFDTHLHFPDHAHRLALLLHLTDAADFTNLPEDPAHPAPEWTVEISEITAARAITLARWLRHHQLPILETLDQQPDPDLEKLTRWLQRAGGQMTLNHLRRHHSFSPTRAQTLVETYPDLLCLTDDPKTTPGRKSQFISLISSSPISPKSPEREPATWSAVASDSATPPSPEPNQSQNSPQSSEAATPSKNSPLPNSPNSPQSPEPPVHPVHPVHLVHSVHQSPPPNSPLPQNT